MEHRSCLLLGYEREEALGREVGALIACAGRLLELQEWFAGLRQLEHAAARTPFETRVQRANGEQVPVRIEGDADDDDAPVLRRHPP